MNLVRYVGLRLWLLPWGVERVIPVLLTAGFVLAIGSRGGSLVAEAGRDGEIVADALLALGGALGLLGRGSRWALGDGVGHLPVMPTLPLGRRARLVGDLAPSAIAALGLAIATPVADDIGVYGLAVGLITTGSLLTIGARTSRRARGWALVGWLGLLAVATRVGAWASPLGAIAVLWPVWLFALWQFARPDARPAPAEAPEGTTARWRPGRAAVPLAVFDALGSTAAALPGAVAVGLFAGAVCALLFGELDFVWGLLPVALVAVVAFRGDLQTRVLPRVLPIPARTFLRIEALRAGVAAIVLLIAPSGALACAGHPALLLPSLLISYLLVAFSVGRWSRWGGWWLVLSLAASQLPGLAMIGLLERGVHVPFERVGPTLFWLPLATMALVASFGLLPLVGPLVPRRTA